MRRIGLARVDASQGHFDTASQGFADALAIARSVNDPRNEGVALGHMAQLHHAQGHLTEARACFNTSEALLRRLRDHTELALLLSRRALLDLKQHCEDDARAALEEAEKILTEYHLGAESAAAKAVEELRIAMAAAS